MRNVTIPEDDPLPRGRDRGGGCSLYARRWSMPSIEIPCCCAIVASAVSSASPRPCPYCPAAK
jgi:hypothetical protein